MNTNPENETKPAENLQLVSYTRWSVQTSQNSRFAWQDGITLCNHQLAHHKHQGCGLQTHRCGKTAFLRTFQEKSGLSAQGKPPKNIALLETEAKLKQKGHI